MMPGRERSERVIKDHFFLETLRCPLKYSFLISEDYPDASRPVYRQRNKLNIRDAVATLFTNVRHTSNETAVALKETRKWLTDDDIAICGAVLQAGFFLTRIPILVKRGDEFTVIQIHGKLRKRTSASNIDKVGLNSAENSYLLKAAYRMEVLRQCYPAGSVKAEFYFPRKDFRAGLELLNRHVLLKEKPSELKENFNDLFMKVTAGRGADELSEQLPAAVVHKQFAGKRLGVVMNEIEKIVTSGTPPAVERSRECKYCNYRLQHDRTLSCWSKHFKDVAMKKPGNHTFDLIGHGNSDLCDKQIWYCEQIEISDGFSSFENIQAHGGPNITMQQRRNLQILRSKGETIPLLWVKEGMQRIKNLKFPLHFLDFEASTYAIPMKRGDIPYKPVYFQFSGITLFDDGNFELNEWLDTDPDNPDPHEQFADELVKIPGIFEGTIIQYSPFEKQAVSRLISDLQRNSMLHAGRIDSLISIRNGLKDFDHFFDLSDWIRNYYFNKYQENGLGLKQVLESVRKLEKEATIINNDEGPILKMLSKNDELKALFQGSSYESIQENGSGIVDGSSAMNAWISLKSGLLAPKEELSVQNVLRKYCTLDAYALLYLYIHMLKLVSVHEGEILMFDEK
ncbi:MAG: DUF2779 domain-containing protein [Balneolaceae bacterium]|nr:MAG: DUF2779 domain-containing protein [Balneolaceae bacterium]